MALVVEDGSAVSGANSYLTEAEADAFHLDRNNTSWSAAAQAEKEAGLIAAAVYLDATYLWVGQRKGQSQGKDWPRTDARDGDGFEIASSVVPQAVKDAAALLALEQLTAALLPSQERGGAIKRKLEKVDVVAEDTTYLESAPSHRTYPIIDRMLSGLITGRAGGPFSRVRRT